MATVELFHLKAIGTIPTISRADPFDAEEWRLIHRGASGKRKLQDVLGPKRGDELARGSESNPLPVVHDGHTVAEPLGFFHIVGGEQNGSTCGLQSFYQAPELPPRLRIEAGGRLVQEEQLRVAHQRAGQGEPLLLSSREAAHAGPRFLSQLHHGDDLLG